MVYEIVFAYNVDMFAMLVVNNIYTSVTIILLLYRYEIFMLHIEKIYNLYQTRNISNIKKYGFCKYKLPETFILFRWSGQCAFIISYFNVLIFNTNYKKIRLLLFVCYFTWRNLKYLNQHCLFMNLHSYRDTKYTFNMFIFCIVCVQMIKRSLILQYS